MHLVSISRGSDLPELYQPRSLFRLCIPEQLQLGRKQHRSVDPGSLEEGRHRQVEGRDLMCRVVVVLRNVGGRRGFGEHLGSWGHRQVVLVLVLERAELEVACHHVDQVVLHLDVAFGGR